MEDSPRNYPQQLVGASMAERPDITVRDNIDAKIARHREAIAELEKTKEEMGPLLDMRIDRLSNAMNGGRY